MDDEIFDEESAQYFKQDEELSAVEYTDLIKKLEDNTFLDEVAKSPQWRIFREAWHRIYIAADKQLDNVDPTNVGRIVESQVTKRFYKDVLATTIRKIKEDAKSAFEQAEERGLLNRIMLHLKKQF